MVRPTGDAGPEFLQPANPVQALKNCCNIYRALSFWKECLNFEFSSCLQLPMKSTPTPSAIGLSPQSLELATPIFRVFDDRPFRGDGDLLALAFAGDGSLWAVEEPGVLRHWNTIGGRQLAWHYLSELEMQWAFSDDARWLASGSDDLSLWDVTRGKLCAELAQPSWITAIAFSRDSALIATGHDDGMVRVWNIAGKRMICEFGGHKGAISAIAFHPDGSPLATAAEQKIIRLWDVPSGIPRGTLTGHTDRIPALAWHPSGRHLYSAGWDTTVRVWDVAKREPVILLNSHATQVNTLTFNRAGTLLAAADSSKRVHLWDAATNQSVQVLTQIDCEIRSLAFSPDGSQLASGGNDRVIHIWSRGADETGWRPAGERRARQVLMRAPTWRSAATAHAWRASARMAFASGALAQINPAVSRKTRTWSPRWRLVQQPEY